MGQYRPLDLKGYEALQGLAGLRRALAMPRASVIDEIQRAGLTGRGGAGFPTALKWASTAREKQEPKYFICNADEGEIGTHKDKVLLDHDPWSVLEGILIAAYAIGAQQAFLYIKGEYEDTIHLWKELVAEARNAGFLGARLHGSDFSTDVQVVGGRGPYIAGEEFALIASLETRRAMSRLKPPYPSQEGLFGKPTVVNNVETVANVPVIMARGASEYRKLGLEQEPGTRLFSLSGDVRNPGVYELELGSGTLRELIDVMGDGTLHGRPVKAVQPGGGTSAFLAPHSLGCLLTAQAIRQAGSAIGTAGTMVYEEGRSAVDLVRTLLEFYGRESCGRCIPCRIGVAKMREIVNRLAQGKDSGEDLRRLREIGTACIAASTCGMGQAFPLPVLSAMALFPEDFAAVLEEVSV